MCNVIFVKAITLRHRTVFLKVKKDVGVIWVDAHADRSATRLVQYLLRNPTGLRAKQFLRKCIVPTELLHEEIIEAFLTTLVIVLLQ